jgi:hypothetical protein
MPAKIARRTGASPREEMAKTPAHNLIEPTPSRTRRKEEVCAPPTSPSSCAAPGMPLFVTIFTYMHAQEADAFKEKRNEEQRDIIAYMKTL